MKQRLFILIAAFLTALSASAAYFEVGGIAYNVLSETDLTCEVTYGVKYYDKVSIPPTVTYNGKTFKVTAIGSYAFYKCSSLISVEMPNSVTTIGEYAFWDCSSLTYVEIPNSVTMIGDYVFLNCSSLTSVKIPNSVTTIGKRAFSGCTNLPVVNNLRYADTYLVEAVDKTLNSYKIKEGTKWIGEYAFQSCSRLTSVKIPNSVTTIGIYAFSGCTNLPVINNLRYADTYLVEAADKTLSSYEIKEGTKWIGEYAFYDCSNLTSVKIPNSVTTIGEYAFYKCSSLTSVEIPNSVTTIRFYAFQHCFSLTSVVIPNSVTTVTSYAFRDCYSLTEITSLSTTPPSVGYRCFSNVPTSTCVLRVPAKAVEAYKVASGWLEFENIVAIGDVDGDGEMTMSDANVVVNAYLGNGAVDARLADVDGDGAITMSDANAIVNMYLGNK